MQKCDQFNLLLCFHGPEAGSQPFIMVSFAITFLDYFNIFNANGYDRKAKLNQLIKANIYYVAVCVCMHVTALKHVHALHSRSMQRGFTYIAVHILNIL